MAQEFEFIAARQNRREDALARRCDRLLVCDTDAFATRLWQERYQGCVSPEVVRAAEGRRMDLYLLTDCGIPFVQDGTRDGEQLREPMQRRFEKGCARPASPSCSSRGRRTYASRRAVCPCEALVREVRPSP